jgi:hypothetical protein
MANGTQASVFNAAATAWQDALAARQRMPRLFLTAISAIAALNLIYFGVVLVGSLFGRGLFASLIGVVYVGLQALFLTPLAIAVHRFMLLSEVHDNYRFDMQEPRFTKFLTFLVALLVVPQLLHAAFGGLIGLVVSIVVVIITVRLVILFPAVAVDAPGAEWQNAMADTKGHSWRVFFILLCLILPVAIVVSIVLVICFIIPVIGWLIGVAVQAAFSVMVVAATAAAASRLYSDYANQLGRPTGIAQQTAM